MKNVIKLLLFIFFWVSFSLYFLIASITRAQPAVSIAFSSITLGIFLILALIIFIDLYKKDDVQIKGKVIEIQNRILMIELQNGKIKRVKIDGNNNPNQYEINQNVTVIETRRSDIVKEIVVD